MILRKGRKQNSRIKTLDFRKEGFNKLRIGRRDPKPKERMSWLFLKEFILKAQDHVIPLWMVIRSVAKGLVGLARDAQPLAHEAMTCRLREPPQIKKFGRSEWWKLHTTGSSLIQDITCAARSGLGCSPLLIWIWVGLLLPQPLHLQIRAVLLPTPASGREIMVGLCNLL